jgi:heme oxygenase (mycobilin-producing)
MISVLQFDVTDEADFTERLHTALRVLAARVGYLSGSAGRSTDDPSRWVLVTEWVHVGAYRRALGNYDVKLYATPLLAQAIDEPSAFEPLLTATPGAEPTTAASDRA